MICKTTDKNKIEILEVVDIAELDKLKANLAYSKVLEKEIIFKKYALSAMDRADQWATEVVGFSTLYNFQKRYENTFILPYNELL